MTPVPKENGQPEPERSTGRLPDCLAMTGGTVPDRWRALDRGWKATLLGLFLAGIVEVVVRAGLV